MLLTYGIFIIYLQFLVDCIKDCSYGGHGMMAVTYILWLNGTS